MWYIILYDMTGAEVARLPLTADAVLSIGSDPSSSLLLPDAAPAQAFVYLTEGYPVIEDGGSGTTILDGFALAAPAYLTAESQLVFGGYALYPYFDDAAFVPPPPPPPPDMAMAPPPPPDMVPPAMLAAMPATAGYHPEASYPPQASLAQGGGQIQINTGEHEVDPAVAAGPVQFGIDAVPIAKRQLKLIAREGYLDGREFILAYDDFFDIGRAPNVELVVDDPSVSRVHARLTLEEGGTLLVQDLRSTNGTFINGKEVKREHASIGDRIRIGEVPFYLAAIGEAGMGGGRFSIAQYKKLMFMFLGIIFLFVGYAIVQVALQKRYKEPEDRTMMEASYDENIKARVARVKAEADELTRLDDWDEAISKYREALSLVPDDRDIKEKMAHALFEKRNYEIFKRALDLKNRMTHEFRIEALKTFGEIDPKSQYYRADVTPIIMELKQDLARHYRDEGTARVKVQHFQQAHENLCRYFELDSRLDDLKTEEQIRLDLQTAERALRNRKEFVPCEAERFLTPRIPVDEMWARQAKDAIFKKYPAGIADQVLVYFTGNPKDAILALQEFVKHPKHKRKFAQHTSLIIELQAQLQNIVQGYEAGETKLQIGDAEGARKEWEVVLNVDRNIIPEGFKSRYSRNIGNRLAKSFYIDGRKSLDLYRYEEAFEFFKKGMDLDPDDTTELLEGLKELEQKSADFMDEAQQMRDSGNTTGAKKLAERVLRITVENSPNNKKARDLLK